MSGAPSGEILYGTKAIATFLGPNERQTLYLIEKRSFPTWREGRTICARRATLAEWVRQREADAIAAAMEAAR